LGKTEEKLRSWGKLSITKDPRARKYKSLLLIASIDVSKTQSLHTSILATNNMDTIVIIKFFSRGMVPKEQNLYSLLCPRRRYHLGRGGGTHHTSTRGPLKWHNSLEVDEDLKMTSERSSFTVA
jgi:hypothetical protein